MEYKLKYGCTLPYLMCLVGIGLASCDPARHICHFICHLNVASFLWLSLSLSLHLLFFLPFSLLSFTMCLLRDVQKGILLLSQIV